MLPISLSSMPLLGFESIFILTMMLVYKILKKLDSWVFFSAKLVNGIAHTEVKWMVQLSLDRDRGSGSRGFMVYRVEKWFQTTLSNHVISQIVDP